MLLNKFHKSEKWKNKNLFLISLNSMLKGNLTTRFYYIIACVWTYVALKKHFFSPIIY